MSNEITRSPAVIAGEINQIKSQTSGILAAALAVAGRGCIEIGKRLVEAKALLPYGEWGAWLEDNVSYSVSTAENLMRIYREYGDEQIDMVTGKSPAEVFAELTYSQMVALFALPAPERAAYVEEHRDELVGEDALSIRELTARIKELEAQNEDVEAALRSAEDSNGRLRERVNEVEGKMFEEKNRADKAALEVVDYGKVVADRDAARARVAELEAQPVTPVEVIRAEPTEEQIAEIRRKALEEAEAKHRGEIEQLEADFGERIEEAKKAARQEQSKTVTEQIAKNNEKNAAALEKAEREIKRLKAAANVHANRITYSLEAILRAMNDIDNEVRAAESDTPGAGAKLKTQVEVQIGKMLDGRGWQV